MTIDLVLKYLKNPKREYDAAEVAWDLDIPEREAQKALHSLWKGGILTSRKCTNRGRLVYQTKQAQLEGVG
jgi:predicted DNA-binding transcriptional regulator